MFITWLAFDTVFKSSNFFYFKKLINLEIKNKKLEDFFPYQPKVKVDFSNHFQPANKMEIGPEQIKLPYLTKKKFIMELNFIISEENKIIKEIINK